MFTGKSHDGKSTFRLKEVVRNFSDETQSVFLVVVLIQPVNQATGEPLNIITLRERKWTVIKSDGARSSIVQTYHQITRDSEEVDYEGLWTRKMLSEAMVPMWTATLSIIQRQLEYMLLEQSMAMRTGGGNSNTRLGDGIMV